MVVGVGLTGAGWQTGEQANNTDSTHLRFDEVSTEREDEEEVTVVPLLCPTQLTQLPWFAGTLSECMLAWRSFNHNRLSSSPSSSIVVIVGDSHCWLLSDSFHSDCSSFASSMIHYIHFIVTGNAFCSSLSDNYHLSLTLLFLSFVRWTFLIFLCTFLLCPLLLPPSFSDGWLLGCFASIRLVGFLVFFFSLETRSFHSFGSIGITVFYRQCYLLPSGKFGTLSLSGSFSSRQCPIALLFSFS